MSSHPAASCALSSREPPSRPRLCTRSVQPPPAGAGDSSVCSWCCLFPCCSACSPLDAAAEPAPWNWLNCSAQATPPGPTEQLTLYA